MSDMTHSCVTFLEYQTVPVHFSPKKNERQIFIGSLLSLCTLMSVHFFHKTTDKFLFFQKFVGANCWKQNPCQSIFPQSKAVLLSFENMYGVSSAGFLYGVASRGSPQRSRISNWMCETSDGEVGRWGRVPVSRI